MKNPRVDWRVESRFSKSATGGQPQAKLRQVRFDLQETELSCSRDNALARQQLAPFIWGSCRDHSFPQTIHQSVVFRDQLWASLSSTTLDFKQPLHQLGKVFHDFLQ
jgi:hypothetical protein